MIYKVTTRYDLSFHVEDYFFKSCMIFAIQILIIIFIVRGALLGTDGLNYVKPTT